MFQYDQIEQTYEKQKQKYHVKDNNQNIVSDKQEIYLPL